MKTSPSGSPRLGRASPSPNTPSRYPANLGFIELGPMLESGLHSRSVLDNVHADDQPVLEAVAVADMGVGDEPAGACLMNHLMNIDGDRAVSFLGEGLGLDLAGDCAELSVPVVTNR